jgi:hypothetical protein
MNINEKEIELNIEFPKIKENSTIFIDKIIIDQPKLELLKSSTPRELYIFGAIVKTGEVCLKFGELKRLELIVIEKKLSSDELIYHHLTQHKSVMYKREFDKTSDECVDMLNKKDILYTDRQPRWKASEASIPKYDDKLFYFCNQIYISKNKTTKEFLTWGFTLFTFLFITEEDELLIQIFEQDTSLQTAEDHYKLEEQMCEFDKNYRNLEIVEKLIKKGDKFLHEYILNHKKADKNILELLVEHGKSKAFKTAVMKKLK